MPITAFLDGHKFDAETKRVTGIAFEMTCVALQLRDQTEPVAEIVARKIIELAKAGERNPNFLCDGVLKEFRALRL